MREENILVIEGSKAKAFLIILIGVFFVLLGIFMIFEGILWGWLVVIFFGLAIPAGVVQILRKSYIKLDLEGFEVNTGVRPWRMKWSEVESFYVGKIYGNKMIGINYSDSYDQQITARKVASSLSGMEGAIPNQFKLKPSLICEQLNQWKNNHTKNA